MSLPCRKVYIQFSTDDPWLQDALSQLIGTISEVDLSYAYHLLHHTSMQPPNECEHLMLQFRNARLEEDGFIGCREAVLFNESIDPMELYEKWSQLFGKSAVLPRVSRGHGGDFLDAVFTFIRSQSWDIDRQFDLHQKFLFLANGLCTFSRVEPYDYTSVGRILEQSQASCGLALDFLADGHVEKGLDILESEHPKKLYRVGVALVEAVRDEVIGKISQLDLLPFDDFRRAYQQKKYGLVQEALNQFQEFFGFENTNLLKALFNRFPAVPVKQGDDGCRIRFQPISSMPSLIELYRTIAVFIGGLAFLRASGVKALETNLERYLATIFANYCLKGSAVFEPLTLGEVRGFYDRLSFNREFYFHGFIAKMGDMIIEDTSGGKSLPFAKVGAEVTSTIANWVCGELPFLEEGQKADWQNTDLFFIKEA